MRLLVMGLPGSGKTTLCRQFLMWGSYEPIIHFNADKLREAANDWDFSYSGRLRQARRMSEFGRAVGDQFVVQLYDFVCPLPEFRAEISPDAIIFMDTIQSGRYQDTNSLFVKPTEKEAKKIGAGFYPVTEFMENVDVWILWEDILNAHGDS